MTFRCAVEIPVRNLKILFSQWPFPLLLTAPEVLVTVTPLWVLSSQGGNQAELSEE